MAEERPAIRLLDRGKEVAMLLQPGGQLVGRRLGLGQRIGIDDDQDLVKFLTTLLGYFQEGLAPMTTPGIPASNMVTMK